MPLFISPTIWKVYYFWRHQTHCLLNIKTSVLKCVFLFIISSACQGVHCFVLRSYWLRGWYFLDKVFILENYHILQNWESVLDSESASVSLWASTKIVPNFHQSKIPNFHQYSEFPLLSPLFTLLSIIDNIHQNIHQYITNIKYSNKSPYHSHPLSVLLGLHSCNICFHLFRPESKCYWSVNFAICECEILFRYFADNICFHLFCPEYLISILLPLRHPNILLAISASIFFVLNQKCQFCYLSDIIQIFASLQNKSLERNDRTRLLRMRSYPSFNLSYI